ncbi:hypothetical protein HJFPF1_12533 [Paramyrothecium foliicola]|nr:hypothetical protein HJFPF1_12533 [Paramyrothecium foliicola]
MANIEDHCPGLAPKPLRWNKYVSSSAETYFLVEDFYYLNMTIPSPSKLIKRVLEMHSISSPIGMIGFPVTTFDGSAPHVNDWSSNWAAFFTSLFRKSAEVNRNTNDDRPDLTLARE